MFSPFKKPSGLLPNLNPNPPREDKPKKPMTPEVKRRLWATVILSVILLAIWYGCMALGEYLRNDALIYGVMIAYFVAFTAFLVAYLAYNRGFVNKDVTVEMLPADWSDEKKRDFVEGNRRRAEKSRWMVTVIIPFAVVFMVEAMYLFVWEGYLMNLFESIGWITPEGGK